MTDPKEPPDHSPSSTDDLEALSQKGRRLVVELTSDGRLRASDPEVRGMLRDRLRQAEVLPTGSGWALLRTLGPSALAVDKTSEREIIAAGTIGERGLSLIDFIGFLASSYETGVITVSKGELERAVYFHKGDVVWAASTSLEDRLGALLLSRGRITPEQLEIVSREGGTRIGRLCVERGFLSAHDLWAMVQAQLTEIFDRLLATEAGLWSFARVSEDVLSESQIHLSTQGLLVDALRRLDELKVYRQRIRSSDVLVRRIEGKTSVEGIAERERKGAAELLDFVQGGTTIRTLMRSTGGAEFEVTRQVYHLLRAGLVELAEDDTGPIPRRTSLVTHPAKEVAEVYGLAVKEMADALGRFQKADVLIQTARDFLADEASGQFTAFYRSVVLRDDGTLDAGRLLAGVQESGLDVQQLSDALSELMFFMLFTATEILGRRRGDDLARRVKMIHGMLMGPGAKKK